MDRQSVRAPADTVADRSGSEAPVAGLFEHIIVQGEEMAAGRLHLAFSWVRTSADWAGPRDVPNSG